MDFKDYLKTNQKIVYDTFTFALRSGHVSHAYLIKGNEGAPLLETAKFLAKTLVCDNPSSLACDECMSCIRFDEGNYADYKLLNGQLSNIKVSDIESLQTFFSSTPSERSGKMIYIIHLLENSNREALNALLKFLEEPQENVHAFITTYNEERLLPTILSRTQHLKLLPLPHSSLIAQCVDHGISEDDAELLTQFYGNADTIVEVATSESYLKIKDMVFDVLTYLTSTPEQTLFFVEKEVIPVIKDKVSARLFLDIFALALKDIINLKYDLEPIIKTQKELLKNVKSHLKNAESIYLEVMLSRGKIELNVNLSLLLEHIFINISQGGNN